MPENGWAYGYEIHAGRTSATATYLRGHLLAVSGGVPGALLGSTAELAVNNVMSYGGDGEIIAGDLTTIVPLIAGTQYAIGVASRGGQLMHGLFTSWPAGTNPAIYQRTSVGSTGPYNPWAHTSIPANGPVAQQVLYVANVKPDVPINRAPFGQLTSAPSAFVGAFRDANETIVGRDNTANEKLSKYRIQLRLKGTTTLLWDSTYTASGTEQTNRAFSHAYGGSGSLTAGNTYEWRCAVADARETWGDWSSWLEFSLGSAGTSAIQTNPGVTGKITTLTPGGFAVRYTHPTAVGMTSAELQILSGGVVVRTWTDGTDRADGASFTITPTYSSTPTFDPLSWSTAYTWRWRATDMNGAPTAWSAEVPFNTDYRPSTPAALDPAGGEIAYGYPELTFEMSDLDDTPASGLIAEVRIKTSGSVLIATRTATHKGGSTWGYQTGAADLAATGTFRWDARGRDPLLDGNYAAETDFYYAEAPIVSSPASGATVAASDLEVTYTITGQVARRVLLYTPGTDTVVYATAWETTSATAIDIALSGIVKNGQRVEVVVEVELAGAVITHSARVLVTFIVDATHSVATDPTSGPVTVGLELLSTAIRMVKGAVSGVTAGNFRRWLVKEGPADWAARYAAVLAPLPEPTLLASLDNSLAGQDPSGAVTLTANGAVRYRNGPQAGKKAYWSEEAGTNLVTNPLFNAATTGWSAAVGSISRVTTYAYMGPASGLLTATGANAQATFALTLTAATHAFSMVVRNNAAAARTFQLRYNSVNLVTTFDRIDPDTPVPAGVVQSGNGVSVPASAVVRLVATATGVASSLAAGVIVTDSANAETFHIGHFQIEQKDHITSPVPLVDATGAIQTGYTWSGTAHASTSTRGNFYAYIARGTKYTVNAGAIHVTYRATGKAPTSAGIIWVTGVWSAGADFIGAYLDGNNQLYVSFVFNAAYSANIVGPILSPHTTYDLWFWWDATTVYLQIDSGTVYQATRTVAPTGTFSTNDYLGLGGGGQEANGLIANVLTLNRVPTATERSRIDALIAAGTLTWSSMGATDYARWLGQVVALTSELETVAESTSFADTELTHWTPRLGGARTYALTAVIGVGVNEVESFPLDPIVAACDVGVVILSDEAEPTRRVWLEWLADYGDSRTPSDVILDTWDDDDGATVITAGGIPTVISSAFTLLPVDPEPPLTVYNRLESFQSPRADGSPTVMCLRDDLGDRKWVKIGKVSRKRTKSGRLEVTIDMTEVRRG
jgi:hypothetical protein